MAKAGRLKILALDPATRCGWAHSDGPCGTWDLSVKREESSGMRLIRLRMKLEELLKSHSVDLVAYEAPAAMQSMQAAKVVYELVGQIKVWCHDHGFQFVSYMPPQLKKFATGKGNAKKEAMVDAFESIVKRPVEDSEHDMVDAWWLLRLVQSEYDNG
jgi:Holliday junction resolvasome RuvABC endonuclease subunit